MYQYDMIYKKQVFKNEDLVTENKAFILNIPSEPKEMTMLQWSKFMETLQDTPDWFIGIDYTNEKAYQESTKEMTDDHWIEYSLHLARCVACVSPNEIQFKELLNSISKKDLNKSAQDTLLGMYIQLVNTVNTYKPKERKSFTHKGKKYIFPISAIDTLGNKTVGNELSTIESIEALNYAQLFASKDKNGKSHFEHPKYKTDTALLACLARRVEEGEPVEQMPLEMQKRRSFIDGRIRTFSDVSFDIALDMGFFLTSSLIASVRTRQLSTLSSHLKRISTRNK